MKGHRTYPDAKGELHLAETEYGRHTDGTWYARPPRYAGIASLSRHQVLEHLDGTITVTPSIAVEHPPEPPWHGFLEGGVWRIA